MHPTEPALSSRVPGALPWRRAAAYLLDLVLLFLVLAPLAFLVQRVTGFTPTTPRATWQLQLLEFSLPVWCYFVFCDASPRGATIGKRWLGLRVVMEAGARLTLPRSLARTAIKLLPWELSHLAAFALGDRFGELTTLQGVLLVIANLLATTWLVLAIVSRGERSVHDHCCATRVTWERW
jgi:uncharacterized RDD family membrane protein YckC